ncbi:MAG: GMC family oxidoreductase [Verrucomicrobia bacterium]|nr:GMC family oxidoreductase [Verrucomicrobiota bacterium]
MIEDARKIDPGTRLETDLCIVGGGAAGICLALEYIKSGKDVILIPGGGPNQTADGIDLYRGGVTPPRSHEPLEENRLRMWGGTTTVWGGRCIPFDPIDFEARSWIPHSGWPIRLDELNSYIQQACSLCEAGNADFDARSVFPDKQGEILRGFDNDDFATWPLERWSIPTDFSRRYRTELDAASNLRVLLYAHAVHLQMDSNRNSLRNVQTACAPGRNFIVAAKKTVLACGALENARLLLAARDILPAGIGNKCDLVGRFYQSHLFGVCGHVVLNNPKKDFVYDFEKDHEDIYCRRRFWLTPEAQRKHGVGNAVGFFFRPVSGASEHRNAMVSSILLVKTLLGGARKGPRRLFQIVMEQKQDLLTHLGIVLKDGPAVFGQLAAVAYTRFFQKRRLPMILSPKSTNRFHLFFQTEHIPDPESRVMLNTSSADEYGMPRLEARIRFSETDQRTVRTLITLFGERMEKSGLGSFVLSQEDQDLLKGGNLQGFNSNSHNIGTTRMSKDPSQGVVNPDCRIHGVDNLYLAGSSIFPTSSHANPTLMIIALSIRLADHLKKLG